MPLSHNARYKCCIHCADLEGCPRFDGHSGPCQVPGCEIEQFETMEMKLETEENVISDISALISDNVISIERENLVKSIQAILGYEPPGLRVLIRTLSHPDVVGKARLYFESLDTELRCSKYEPPWSCAKEAEAQYQNIKFGWLGGAGGIGFDESWCPQCRRKVMGE